MWHWITLGAAEKLLKQAYSTNLLRGPQLKPTAWEPDIWHGVVTVRHCPLIVGPPID